MKRIALAVAVVVMAAGACKKAQNSSTAADSTKMMADSMKMAPGDTTHMMMADTSKAHMAAPTPPPAPAPAKPAAKRP
ncbi:MAG TPA: hypothetical protein VMR92_11430 [Gemmatimonadales bacterium]|nr:hypothetical protein [Gemmatimonadales bacterium]